MTRSQRGVVVWLARLGRDPCNQPQQNNCLDLAPDRGIIARIPNPESSIRQF
jgi:hypothetical protein